MRPDPLKPPRSVKEQRFRDAGGMPNRPMEYVGIAYNEVPGKRGHIDIGDAAPLGQFCGRSCAFQHGTKSGWNMEHFAPMEGSPNRHERFGKGDFYMKTHSDPDFDYHHGVMLSPLNKKTHSQYREMQAENPAHTACTNCGRPTV